MTATTIDTAPTGRPKVLPGAIAMEWTKLWTVRSTWWSLGAALLLMGGFSLLMSLDARTGAVSAGIPAAGDLLAVGHPALLGTVMAQFALIAVAMMAMTSEYSHGSISGTLQAVPSRGRLLAAKAIVVVGTLTVVGVGLGLLGALTATLALGPYAEVAAAEVAADVLTVALYSGLVAAMVLGIGAALRSGVATLTVVILLLLVLPSLLPVFGIDAVATVGDHLPGSATNLLLAGAPLPYSPTTAMIILGCWAAAALGLGAVALRRRDA